MKNLIAAAVIVAFSAGAYAQPSGKTAPAAAPAAASAAATGAKSDKKDAAKPAAKHDMKAKKGASAP